MQVETILLQKRIIEELKDDHKRVGRLPPPRSDATRRRDLKNRRPDLRRARTSAAEEELFYPRLQY